MTPWKAGVTAARNFDRGKIDLVVGLRNTLGVAIALGCSHFLEVPHQVALILGAMLVANADRSDSYRLRGSRLFAASCLCAVAVGVASWSAQFALGVSVLAVLLAFAAGFVVVLLDQALTDLATLGFVGFVIFATRPYPAPEALTMGACVLGGGMIQTILSLALWSIRRYRPEQRELSRLLATLAVLREDTADADQPPPASEESSRAQTSLAALANDFGPEGLRYRSLLSQAERVRLNLLSLGRLRRHLGESSLGRSLDVYTQEVSDRLGDLSQSLVTGTSRPWDGGLALEFASHPFGEEAVEPAFTRALHQDILYHMQSLTGQLRILTELVHESSAHGEDARMAQRRSLPWKLRAGGALATLQVNCQLHSPGFRHALRLAASIGVGEVLMRWVPLGRPYWIPMTIMLVLKPEFDATIARFILRVGGTILGLLLATGLFHLIAPREFGLFTLFLGFTFALRWLGGANYGILAMCVSGQVVLLFALSGTQPGDVIWARLIDTALGGMVALMGYWAWPTQEREQLEELLAQLLTSYRDYAGSVFLRHGAEQTAAPGETDALRWNVRSVRSRLLASAGRYLAETTDGEEKKELLRAISASSNRLAHAMIGVETAPPVEWRDQGAALRAFLASLDALLAEMALSMRAVPAPRLEAKPRPELRALFVALAKSQGEQASRNEPIEPARGGLPILAEMDRMTNSVLTLYEQLGTWNHDERALSC